VTLPRRYHRLDRVQPGFRADHRLLTDPTKGNVMRAGTIAIVAATVVALGGMSAAAAASAGGPASGTPTRSVNHGRFTNPRENPYFPLKPGTVFHYRGTDDGEKFTERVEVTRSTKKIQGVTTTVVRDVVRRADGSVAEKTDDWYAADNHGNVWYFGENTATYDESGHLESREGSFQAGVDGAVVGIIMPAHPKPTDAYRQEFYRGHAEDQAWIVERGMSTTVPYGRLHDVVRSFEWTRLEKKVMSEKLYAPGLGLVRERDTAGGSEFFALVSVTHQT